MYETLVVNPDRDVEFRSGSHERLWRIVASKGDPCLILEDDCVLTPDFESRMDEVMKTIPSDWDVAILGYSGSDVNGDVLLAALCNPFMKRRTMHKVNDHWHVPGVFIGSHCYLLSPSGARKLLRNADTSRADAVMCRDVSCVLYCSSVSLARSRSDVHHLMNVPLAEMKGGITVRIRHVIAVYVASVTAMLVSGSETLLTAASVFIGVPLIHYIGTMTHTRAALKRTEPEGQDPHEAVNKVNDMLSTFILGIVMKTALRKQCANTVVRLYMFLMVMKGAVSNAFEMATPHAACDRRSINRYSVFEYCGDLRVSGHIIPALLLCRFSRKLGIPLLLLQAFTILQSKSHYPVDMAYSFILVQLCAPLALRHVRHQ